MSKTLATLVKVHSHEVDQQRRAVVELEEGQQRMRDALASHLALIDQQKEAARVNDEAARALPVWLDHALAHEQALHQQIAQFEEWLVEARDELQSRYAELKKYEIAYEAERTREAAERLKAEQIVLDEIAGQRAERGDAN